MFFIKKLVAAFLYSQLLIVSVLACPVKGQISWKESSQAEKEKYDSQRRKLDKIDDARQIYTDSESKYNPALLRKMAEREYEREVRKKISKIDAHARIDKVWIDREYLTEMSEDKKIAKDHPTDLNALVALSPSNVLLHRLIDQDETLAAAYSAFIQNPERENPFFSTSVSEGSESVTLLKDPFWLYFLEKERSQKKEKSRAEIDAARQAAVKRLR